MKSIYLCGPIAGQTFGQSTNWRNQIADLLKDTNIEVKSPLRGKQYLKDASVLVENPGAYLQPLSTDKAIIGRDRFDVMTSDIIVSNFSEATKVSIGSMVEFGWADAFRKPILLITGKDQEKHPHHHSFVYELATWHVHTLEDAAMVVKSVLLPGVE